MPRPSPTTDPELKAHREWLGYLQPVGLVVAPAAMLEAGWVVTRSGSELIERQERYREALEPLGAPADTDDNDAAAGDNDNAPKGFRSLAELLTDHLGWDPEQLDTSGEAIAAHTKELPELGETLKPTAVVPAAGGEGAQLLVIELPPAAAFDQKTTDGEHLWRASAQERLERLLRETGVEAGLLFNGRQLRLVVAPKGESSGHLTFTLSELAEVSGRLMLSGLDLLLGLSHVFLDPDGTRLADVLKKSRSFQAVVSNALADQVLAALWDLLRGFQQADELAQRQEAELLGDLPERDPQQLYGGLITVLMRLVFLLYAEDEALMPADAVYELNYKVSGIYEQLQRDEAEYPDTMEQRYGAWAGLMSLCRLVFDGGGPSVNYLPARKGQLFNPREYPWLETPWISDGVVLAVLRNLLIVNGERISYRALDVEQIGSVYEGIMGYAVRRIPGRCIGLKSKPQGAKKQLTSAVDLDALLALPGGKRKAWLEEEASTTLPAKSASALKDASSEAELLEALAPRINRDLFDGPQASGGLVFQPTEERRRSGSHYTPRSLTRPIVEEALRPWLERCGGKPTVAQILALKICDPAMGSGAFLVECCRYLAELLEQAWAREGLPDALKPGGSAHGEEPLIYARRLIAQSCLYGVDKNPFAVNLARLSLWLVSLSKDAPFTFVDHALKCGDSLVGMERSEIEAALKGASLQRELQIAYLDQVRQQEARSFALFHADSRSDADDAQKRQALDELNASTAYLRTVGDLLVAAFFNGKKPKDREALKNLYLQATMQHSSAAALEDELAEPLQLLRDGEEGIQPLHWQLAFPDVFGRSEPGFDAFVGNPPFMGGHLITGTLGINYFAWITAEFAPAGHHCDLVAYFLRRAFQKLRTGGTLGIICTNSVYKGDTRNGGLLPVRKSKGWIYRASTKIRWPGLANVWVSILHVCKGDDSLLPVLNGIPCPRITAYLRCTGPDEDPRRLSGLGEIYSKGSQIYGQGFLFDDTDPKASSIAEMEHLISISDDYRSRIFPYFGGSEAFSSPTLETGRWVIYLSDLKNEGELDDYPELKKIIQAKVKPERDALKLTPVNKPLKEKWWAYQAHRPSFYSRISDMKRIIVTTSSCSRLAFVFLPTGIIYSQNLVCIAYEDGAHFALLQSSLNEIWTGFCGGDRGKGYFYVGSDCFETFPQPVGGNAHTQESPAGIKWQALDAIGEEYHDLRASAMRLLNYGLTALHHRLNDPSEGNAEITKLRIKQAVLDAAVLSLYGWSDINAEHGFCLDYLDLNEEALIPDAIQCRIDSGETFFDSSDEACDFQSQLLVCGAINSLSKVRWRYCWPDAVRDEVLARLLALNAERYAEEVAQGLHGKAGKKPAADPTAGGKRRAPPAFASQGGETVGQQTEQMGLGL